MKDLKSQNEYVLKLAGKAYIPQELEIGRNYKITSDGTITAKIETDLDNGSHLLTFKFSPVLVEIQEEGKPAIRAKDVRRQSQKLRGIIYRQWQEDNVSIEFEIYYEKKMLNIIQAVIEGLL